MKVIEELKEYTHIYVDTLNMASIEFYSKRTLEFEGRLTGMLYGGLRRVRWLQKQYPTAQLTFLWEGRSSIRKQKSSLYKANRTQKADPFLESLSDLKLALNLLRGVYHASHVGLEADDLAGYFCSTVPSDARILLVSGDRDWWQFARENVDFLVRQEIYTSFDLEVRLGYLPQRIGLFKVLRGDASDGVPPAVARFPTTLATFLVQNVSTVDELFSITHVPAKYVKWMERLRAAEEQVRANAELVLYQPDWVDVDRLEVVPSEGDTKRLQELLRCRGITSL